ncbi:formate dehydrogenase accessory sulfurtransferase FdhD [Paenibacillus paeoniae]|uniref:Sulfur carrier protein FdhD n=1 Tax=Paenibacillus paeoniae TaxID=2292705 RepID=A0A371PEN9_9BACL|nr:formate dehydrogenase accessory sulfurtransferase FdhD [Paenibacillus paeoniae]REK74359.1 formate dehydrogenase accessory sulfurtransferase FdhD [Paenibacillus paeoniae]
MERGNLSVWGALRYRGDTGQFEALDDQIATEYALTVKLDGEEFATIVCSPTHLRELVYGFLASEGMIREAAQVKHLHMDEDSGYAYAELAGQPSVAREKVSKRFIGSCCGKSRQFYFHTDMLTARTIMTRRTITPEQCISYMVQLQKRSSDFHSSGGVHNAALAEGDGLLAVMTDVGRHNALDKLYGHCLLQRIHTSGKAIVFSGRLSSEVVLKAAKMGCDIVLSKSAPTDLALRLADDLGITCVGFIRGSQFTVYTHTERIAINHSLP